MSAAAEGAHKQTKQSSKQTSEKKHHPPKGCNRMPASHGRHITLGRLLDPQAIRKEGHVVEVLLLSIGASESDQSTVDLLLVLLLFFKDLIK